MWDLANGEVSYEARAIHDEKSASVPEMPPSLVLRLRPTVELSVDQLLELSSLNDDLRLELTAEREPIVMTPAGGCEQAKHEAGDPGWDMVRR